ncbi:uncharacterized protein [Euphorbia lathyris]|uniref:uncharacterized protein n=1 Tax=Euphorbia lathyris TaxID=212925 RepID=UPI0033131855
MVQSNYQKIFFLRQIILPSQTQTTTSGLFFLPRPTEIQSSGEMAMESISSAVFTLNNNSFQVRNKFSLIRTSKTFPFSIRYHGHRRSQSSIIQNYKRYDYDYQDFQAYAKPSRLLGATEPKVCLETVQEKNFTSLHENESQSLFKVKLQTSNAYGSSLSDENAGILLCLIDTNGDSILQRIPVLLKSDSSSESVGLVVESRKLNFQRGSVDELIFRGPKLERIEALWISIESGQWRFGGASLTVISTNQHSAEETDSGNFQITALQYEFEVDDLLLGERCDIAMVELRPTLVSELSGADPSILLSKAPSESTTKSTFEDSMKEYLDLKLSLLSYDAALIFVGTTATNFSLGENVSAAFFIGGIVGFLYLLLLQKSVDGLEVSSPISGETRKDSPPIFGETGRIITGLALAIGLTSLGLKYVYGDFQVAFTSKELLFGMMGFLGCKVAVVLAAFKPISIGLEETES